MNPSFISNLINSKQGNSMISNKMVQFIIGAVVLMILISIPSALNSDVQKFDISSEEALCKTLGPESYTKLVYCADDETNVEIPENFKYQCGLDSEEYRNAQDVLENLKKDYADYLDVDSVCEVGDKNCDNCILQAFRHQRQESLELLGVLKGNTASVTIGDVLGGEIEQEESLLKYLDYSYDDFKNYFEFGKENSSNQQVSLGDGIQLLDVNTPINSYVPLDLTGVEKVLRKNGRYEQMESYLIYFDSASKKYNINPYYLLAHFSLESGWGSSRIWNDKNNGFGIGAFDDAPYTKAYTFSSQEEGILKGAEWIAYNYIHNQEKISGEQGPRETLHKMNFRDSGQILYASDRQWAEKIASLASNFILESDSYKNIQETKGNELIEGNVNAELSSSYRDNVLSNSAYSNYIRYQNENSIRSYGVTEDLEKILASSAQEVGVVVVIYSGGQMGYSEMIKKWPGAIQGKKLTNERKYRNRWFDRSLSNPLPRTGSKRHDYGNAADLWLELDGKTIRYDHPKFNEFVRVAFRTGIKSGSSRYMGPERMHVDIVGGNNFWLNPYPSFVNAANQGIADRK